MPTLEALPQPFPSNLDHLWAKSPTSRAPRGESLVEHTWRVLVRLRDLRQLRPALADQVGQPQLWSWLFWACLLHDLGKSLPAFQARLRKETRDSPAAKQWAKHRHEVFSLAFVDWVFPQGTEGRAWVIAAIATHHRDQTEIEDAYPREEDAQLDAMLRTLPREDACAIFDWLATCARPWAHQLGFTDLDPAQPALSRDQAVQLLAQEGARLIRRALDVFSRWSSNQPETTRHSALLLRGLITQADHAASAYVGTIRAFRATPAALRQQWQSLIPHYHAHQQRAESTEGSAVLIAPTGSGKTEAALLWAAAQGAPRLFYTLPYQASMNAMWRRLARIFHPRDVQLQHGRGLLALYRLLMEIDPTLDEKKAHKQALWRENLVRLHHSPIHIFSPYQMLKAAYRLDGYEGMWTDFHGAAFVLDEIHAYEPARLALIFAMMRRLREAHAARFFVMSATLPSIILEQLRAAIGDFALIRADAELYAASTRHTLFIRQGDLLDPHHWQDIVAAACEGLAVLVCVNTVSRAQYAAQRLRAALPNAEVVLLHGRFNARDRSLREKRLLNAVSTRAQHRRPIALVATQVIEVSLDVDFDVLFTDPAPLEALVQRFGRVNRRGRRQPTAPVNVFTQPTDDRRPYDQRLVEAALRVLQPHHGKPIAEDCISTWLDAIYSDSTIRTNWLRDFEHAQREFVHTTLDRLRAFQAADKRTEELFYRAFDGVEVLPACLQGEWHGLPATLAQELLVPLRHAQLARLRRTGRVLRERYPIVVDVPYRGDEHGIGLDLSVLSSTPSADAFEEDGA
ncbi:MAG: CRISPR-associated helicase Cas3' [Anaerolineae bacterium]|nr:CRISPR-associated helicase Cas3' [Anaerolineae bacterium]